MRSVEKKRHQSETPNKKHHGGTEERRRAKGDGADGPLAIDEAWGRDVRFGRGGTVSFESLRSNSGQNSVRNHQNSARILGIEVEKTRKNHPVDPNEKEEKAENNMVHRRRSNRHVASLGCKSDVAEKGSTADDRVATTDSTNPS